MTNKPRYNPSIHHRRSIRLKGYDYSQAGLYFITICCQNRMCRFGFVENGKMVLNKFGKIANDEWAKLPERFPNIESGVFQIMPNHMHGIISLREPVGAGFTPAQNDRQPQDGQPLDGRPKNGQPKNRQPQGIAPTVSNIVGAYKSLVANGCLEIYKSTNETMGKLWQRNYYEHIIRNEQSYQTISEYIVKNPAKWNEDKFFM